MGAALTRQFGWYGYTSRGEYRRCLALIIPVQILLITATWLYGTKGTIHLQTTIWGLAVFAIMLVYAIGLLILTARRFRSAGLSRGWLILSIFSINIPIGPYYWNVSATAILIAIVVASTVADVPADERVY